MIDINPVWLKRGIKFFNDEIVSLKNAPKINGCLMTQEWDEQLHIFENAALVCKEKLRTMEQETTTNESTPVKEILVRKVGTIYDIYEKEDGRWVWQFSRVSADNVFDVLSTESNIKITFEEYQN